MSNKFKFSIYYFNFQSTFVIKLYEHPHVLYYEYFVAVINFLWVIKCELYFILNVPH